MRVLDTTPIDSYTILNMGKKNRGKRKESAANVSSDDEKMEADVRCKHINRSVNLGAVKKGLSKQSCIGQCQMCDDRGGLGVTSADSADKRSDAVVNDDESSAPQVYMCLYCAFQGCDRTSEKKHALGHYETQRSSPHAMSVNLSTWQVWCYTCDDFVDVGLAGGRLEECVQYIRKQSSLASVTSSNHQRVVRAESIELNGRRSHDVAQSSKSVDTSDKTSSGNKKTKEASILATDTKCSKVKGLMNLGNTCFFNAVMQNLTQTHVLDVELHEYSMKGKQLTLEACATSDLASAPNSRRTSRSDDKQHDDDDDDDNDDTGDNGSKSASTERREIMRMAGESIVVGLGDSGPLTRSLLQFLNEMNSKESNKNNVVKPGELFGHICQKAPRFKGFQQQDSHELLHYLLDGIKSEESRRLKQAILKTFNLTENVKPKDVPENSRLKIKAYSSHTRHSFVDGVFGGFFINTVICEDCHTHHQIFESFLDISLPINEDNKIDKPIDKRSHDLTGDHVIHESSLKSEQSKQSKNMTKKQMKSQRKNHKKQNKRMVKLAGSGTVPGENSCLLLADDKTGAEPESVNQIDEEEISEDESQNKKEENDDADIEDNFDENDLSRPNSAQLVNNLLNNSNKTPESCESIGNIENISDKSGNHCSGRIEAEITSCVNGMEKVTLENNISDNVEIKINGTQDSEIDSSKSDTRALIVENGNVESNAVVESSVSQSDNVCDNSLAQEEMKVCNGVSQGENLSPKSENSRSKNNSSNGSVEEHKSTEREKSVESKSVRIESEESVTVTEPGNDVDSGLASLSNSNNSTSLSNDIKSEAEISKLSAQLKNSLKLSSKEQELEQERDEARRMSTRSIVPCITTPAGEKSLSVSLRRFTAQERLYGENRFMCSTCNKGRDKSEGVIRSNAIKQMLIFCPPAVLVLHLKRFQQVGYNLRKDNRHVSFPEILDIAPYCSALAQGVPVGQTQVLYSLYGLVEHAGTLRGGHYTAYVKVRQPRDDTTSYLQTLCAGTMTLERQVETLRALRAGGEASQARRAGTEAPQAPALSSAPGKWYNISDSHVREVNVESVYKAEAYMLFYERVL